MNTQRPVCPVCEKYCSMLDAVDFNKSCAGDVFPPSGKQIHYALCGNCGFCFAPELCDWPLEKFEQRIYNDKYILVDPDYVETRPKANAAALFSMFGNLDPGIRHLDYGGGNGTLVNLLRELKWNSTSYDPFVDRDLTIKDLGKFDLITAFEVFEHVPDVWALMSNLDTLMAPNGIILFSTLLSEGNIRPNEKPTWWYASPRNGHISLFTSKSLGRLAGSHSLGFGSFSSGFHVFHREVPHWATHLASSV